MILTSHQPNFLPYMGVIYKAYKSDAIVLSDDVCYCIKNMWENGADYESICEAANIDIEDYEDD